MCRAYLFPIGKFTDHRSIIIVLFTYNIELINITNFCIACPLMFVIVAWPLNFYIAQLSSVAGLSLGCLLCELAAAISLFKILLVTHFSIIFHLDPDQLGLAVLLVAAGLAFLPTAAISAYQTSQAVLPDS
jgi:hypothetical protein